MPQTEPILSHCIAFGNRIILNTHFRKTKMKLVNFDMDALRALVTGVDLGGFVHAARRLNRSPSAISMQMRKLEAQAAQCLVKRHGRGLILTEAGEVLLAHARRVLSANDELAVAIGAVADAGTVRVGIPQDFADIILPELLTRFAANRPLTHVDVRAGRNYLLAEEVAAGRLDLSIGFAEAGTEKRRKIAALPMVWIGTPGWSVPDSAGSVVPLVMFDGPCLFREAGIGALNRVGRAWRLAMTTPSLPGVWCGVGAGLGLTVRTSLGIPQHLCNVPRSHGIPRLPPIDVALFCSQTQTIATRLFKELLVAVIREKCMSRRIDVPRKTNASKTAMPRRMPASPNS